MPGSSSDDHAAEPGRTAATRSPTRLGPRYHRLFGATVSANLGDGIGAVAYPWLATAITRNPLLIAGIAVAQRLPWLVLSLPAGVVTDRVDRRRAMIAMDALRAVLTALVALVVLVRQETLPAPDAVDAVAGTDVTLYLVVLAATLLLGSAEVLRDNCAQTILPAIVPTAGLQRANGRLWSAESVANNFVGPPLGSVLLAVSFAVPFAVHAGAFAAATVLLMLIPGTYRAVAPTSGTATAGTPGASPPDPLTAARPIRSSWRRELAEGVGWLWAHPLLRPMAVVLGIMNAAMAMTLATFVLFAQENLGVGPLLFTVIGFGGAIGAIVGGFIAPWLTTRLGPGRCLALTLGGSALAPALVGVSTHWAPVLALFSLTALLGIVWNVITVSLRQEIIPSHLLGRVNSVYRFFAWGMMPIGAAVGGVLVAVLDGPIDRSSALRSVWFVSAGVHLTLLLATRQRFTTERIEAARAAANAPEA